MDLSYNCRQSYIAGVKLYGYQNTWRQQLAQQEQQNYSTITVPQEVDLEVCVDIRQELQTRLLSMQRLSCLICLARGKDNLPHRLVNSSGTSCGCPSVARRYVLSQ